MGIGRKLHNLLHPVLGRVLMLHRVVEHIGPQAEARRLEVTADFFAKSLDVFQSQGLEFIGIGQIAERLKSKSHKPFVCITFDDGYMDTYSLAYPVLKDRQIPFCVYLTRDFYQGKVKPHWNPEAKMMREEQVLALASDPLCTIGAHTCSHPHLSQLSEELQRREIEECKSDLEKLTGKPILHFAYPYGDFDKRTVRMVHDLGFETAVTTSGRQVRDDVLFLELDRVSFMQPE